MKTFAQKLKSLFLRKKPLPWYKRILKKTVGFVDMKRRNKILTFFALLFVAVYLCIPSMEGIVKKLVHQYGSALTGTSVNVRQIKIRPTSGEGRVRGISIANPKAYKSKKLFTLNEIAIQIDLASVTSDTIVINKIVVDKPLITYEMLSLTQNNVSDILDHIQAQTVAQTSDSKAKTNSDKNESEKKVVIKNLVVQNGQIDVMAGLGQFKKPISLSLPTISMKNIGQEQKGTSIVETFSLVLKKILGTALQTVSSSGLRELGTQTTEVLQDAGNSVVDTGKNAVDGLKKIFN